MSNFAMKNSLQNMEFVVKYKYIFNKQFFQEFYSKKSQSKNNDWKLQ